MAFSNLHLRSHSHSSQLVKILAASAPQTIGVYAGPDTDGRVDIHLARAWDITAAVLSATNATQGIFSFSLLPS